MTSPTQPILSVAIQYGLLTYVREKLAEDPTSVKSRKSERSLLTHAIAPAKNTRFFRFNVELVAMLLQHGADPNQRFMGRSPWENALLWNYEFMQEAYKSGKVVPKERTIEQIKIFRVLLEKGAKPNAFCYCSAIRDSDGKQSPASRDNEYSYHSALFLVTNTFMRTCPIETAELQKFMKQRGAKQRVSSLKLAKIWLAAAWADAFQSEV